MMPMYGCMDSHPEHRNQTFSFPQYPYPHYQPSPPMTSMPWPYGGNFIYPNPGPCHSCCNHNAAGYNGCKPSSFPQTTMPSPMPFAGVHPAPYYESYAYPVHYVPPPHYSMELPKFEYDNSMPGGFHCCGCPNHSHQNANKGVKIEEHEAPDAGENLANDSVLPAQIKNSPYPIFWIPPEYMKGNEQRKLHGPEIVEQNKSPDGQKRQASLRSHEGDQRRGLLPFDMDKVGSLVRGGNGERVQDKKSKDRMKENPYPIFWMPYDNSHEGAEKDPGMEASQQQKLNRELMRQFPFPFFLVPREDKSNDLGMQEKENEGCRRVDADARNVPTKQADSGDNGTKVNKDKSSAAGVIEKNEKDASQKVMPVKQMEQPKKEDESEHSKRRVRVREVPVKHVDEKPANKSSSSNALSQSSPPKKTTKLPPVCLRVDPLPSKKKKADGSSRSPSPSGHKEGHKEVTVDNAKSSASCSLQEKLKQNDQSHDNIPSNGNEVMQLKDTVHSAQIPVDCKEASARPTVRESGKDGLKTESIEDHGTGKSGDATPSQNVEDVTGAMESAKSDADESNNQKKRQSNVAAAVLIQSAWRGFMARRWEPLKKLKQIAEVREQVNDIRIQIASLESSDTKKDEKQRVVIGETIMRLLLKLDTFQGLLPGLREMRRSLARELVVLQDKLDDITSNKSQRTVEEVPLVKSMEEVYNHLNTSVCMSEQQAEEARKVEEEFPTGGGNNSQTDTEPCQEQVTHGTNSLPAEIGKPELPEHKALDTSSENRQDELNVGSAPSSKDLGSELTMGMKDTSTDGQLDAGHAALADRVVASDATNLEQCGKAPASTEDEGDHSILSAPERQIMPPEALEEVRQVVADSEPVVSELKMDEPSDMGVSESKQGEELITTVSPDSASPTATGSASDEKEVVIQERDAEMPLDSTAGDDVSELKGEEEVQIKDNAIFKSQVALLPQQTQEGMMEGDVDNEELAIPHPEAKEQHEMDANRDAHQQVVSETMESQPANLPDETPSQDTGHQNESPELVDDVDTCSSILADVDMRNEDEFEAQVDIRKEELEDYIDLQVVSVEDETQMQEIRADCRASDAADNVKDSAPVEKCQSLPASEVSSLSEENEKLRDTLQKMMEAGKEQLQVISQLTGRVKDLEKKLAKKNRPRRSKCRAAKPLGNVI